MGGLESDDDCYSDLQSARLDCWLAARVRRSGPAVSLPGWTDLSEMRREPNIAAVELYRECVFYLTQNGWGRDGDDPGIWLRGEQTGVGFQDALAIQFVCDGIDFAWTA